MEAGDLWRPQREQLKQRIEDLKQQCICPTCYDLETGGALYGDRYSVFEDDCFKVTLEQYPRMRGHTTVIYKPHRADLSELSAEEAGRVFQVCVSVVRSLKEALGAEKTYLATMCDGAINHLHVQLLPLYAGDPIGSTRFIAERHRLADGAAMMERIRSALVEPSLGVDLDVGGSHASTSGCQGDHHPS